MADDLNFKDILSCTCKTKVIVINYTKLIIVTFFKSASRSQNSKSSLNSRMRQKCVEFVLLFAISFVASACTEKLSELVFTAMSVSADCKMFDVLRLALFPSQVGR